MPLPAATSCSARLFLSRADAVRPALIGTDWRSTAAGTAVTCSRGPQPLHLLVCPLLPLLQLLRLAHSLPLGSLLPSQLYQPLPLSPVGRSPPDNPFHSRQPHHASPELNYPRCHTLSQSGLQSFRSSPGLNQLSRSRRLGDPSTVACAWCSSSWRVYGRFSLLLVQRRVANSRVAMSTVAGHFPKLLLTSLLELLVSWLQGLLFSHYF
ncbi:hypothetical protein GN244_ATG05381 [Phytophthora infestans]|uniref:Uncharacterized protein n=1 Tax=Phytophthora infestans TaxID=4787 RepID=A0A833WHQ3_PHYIN|nr:hypothetical protein GN244_ATG05381 [Phytophthora infestans]